MTNPSIEPEKAAPPSFYAFDTATNHGVTTSFDRHHSAAVSITEQFAGDMLGHMSEAQAQTTALEIEKARAAIGRRAFDEVEKMHFTDPATKSLVDTMVKNEKEIEAMEQGIANGLGGAMAAGVSLSLFEGLLKGVDLEKRAIHPHSEEAGVADSLEPMSTPMAAKQQARAAQTTQVFGFT